MDAAARRILRAEQMKKAAGEQAHADDQPGPRLVLAAVNAACAPCDMQLIYLLRRGMRRIIPKETLTGNSD